MGGTAPPSARAPGGNEHSQLETLTRGAEWSQFVFHHFLWKYDLN